MAAFSLGRTGIDMHSVGLALNQMGQRDGVVLYHCLAWCKTIMIKSNALINP